MQPENKNRFDDMLRNKLAGAPSRLPNDMLDRILNKDKRKKRLMFWWLNFAVGVYALVLVLHLGSGGWLGNTISKSEETHVGQEQKKEQLRAANGADNSKENAADVLNQRTENGAGESEYLNPKSAKSNAHVAVGAGAKNANRTRRQYASGGGLAWGSEDDGAGYVDEKKPANPESNTGSRETDKEPGTPANDIEPMPIKAPIVEEKPEAKAEENKEDKPEEIAANSEEEKDSTDPRTPKIGLQLVAGLGLVNERQYLGLRETNERYTHRDLASVLQSSASPAAGVEFALGLRASLSENFAMQAGVQYMGLTNHFNVDYFVEYVPVVDTNGAIKGYIELEDSFKTRIVINRTFKTSVISVPLEFSYMKNFGKDYALSLGLGIRPQLHMVKNWALPQNVQLLPISWVEMKQLFSAPTTISFGLYKSMDDFTFGLNGRINPRSTGARDLASNITFRSRQMEFGLVCLYRLNNKKEQ